MIIRPEQLEQAARAVCRADFVLPDEYGVGGRPRWTQYVTKAKAALATLGITVEGEANEQN